MVQHAWAVSVELNLPIVRICELNTWRIIALLHESAANRAVWKHLATSLLAGQGVTQTFSTRCGTNNHGIFLCLEERARKILKRLWTFSAIYVSFCWGFLPGSLAPWVAQLVIASAMTLDTSAGSLCNDRPSAPPSGSHIRKMWNNILYSSFYVDSLDLKTLKQ